MTAYCPYEMSLEGPLEHVLRTFSKGRHWEADLGRPLDVRLGRRRDVRSERFRIFR